MDSDAFWQSLAQPVTSKRFERANSRRLIGVKRSPTKLPHFAQHKVIKVLKRGNWSINGKGRLRKEILKTRKDFYDAAQDYIRKAAVTNRLHNAYRQLFTDMITVSKR